LTRPACREFAFMTSATHTRRFRPIGVDLKIASERLGHANMSVTAQIYTHRSTGNDAGTATRIAELIFKPPATN
jgi:integrase